MFSPLQCRVPQEERGAVCPDGIFSLNLPIFSVSGNVGIVLGLFCLFFLTMSNLCCRLMLLLFVNSGL